jgi:hypothetical protein
MVARARFRSCHAKGHCRGDSETFVRKGMPIFVLPNRAVEELMPHTKIAVGECVAAALGAECLLDRCGRTNFLNRYLREESALSPAVQLPCFT